MAADSPSSPPPGGDPLRRAVLATFTARNPADLLAARLQAHGLECWVETDDCGGVYPNLAAANGVRVLVLTSQKADAEALWRAEPLPNRLNRPKSSSPCRLNHPSASPAGPAPAWALCWCSPPWSGC